MTQARSSKTPNFPLFVPADRPERFAKACQSGADGVIIDFEDAVAPDAKAAVRRIPEGALPDKPATNLYLRINGPDTPWYCDDVAFARSAQFDGVMLPKTETADQIATLRTSLKPGQTVIALVETVAGVAEINAIANASDRVAFGSIDFAEDMGCGHTRLALLPIRSLIIRAARLSKRPAPLDGVTTSIDDTAMIAGDAAHAKEMGFGGKLLIHPAQIEATRKAFQPGEDEVDWAKRVLDVAADGAAVRVDGAMVDAPVVARARRILAHFATAS